MLQKRLMIVFGLIMVAGMLLAACGTAAPAAPAAPQVVVQTQVVEKVITPTPGPAEAPKLSFTTPHPILSELKVRQALAYCTNKLDLVKASYPLNSDADNAKLPMNTFIPASSWAYAGDANVTIYPFDAAKGAALLEEAGWKLNADDGFRYNAAGDQLLLHFTTTNATFRQTWAAVWEKQMADCGVLIIRQHVPASWWFGDATGLKRRDFELGAYAWVGQPDPGGQTLYACDQIPTVENKWTGQNVMGWCNQLASDNIKLANNTLIKAERVAAYKITQQEFTKDVPSIPLFNRSSYYAWNKDFTGLSIAPGDQDYYTWNPEAWEIKGKDTIVLGFTQEPSTLFQPLVDAIVARYASQLVTGLPYTSQNYDYQPVQQKQLATIENGAATNVDVEVKAGDKVVDASGNIITLDAKASPLQKVKDSTGAEVEFKGDPIKMKQMTVKYELIDGMTFSDGVPLAQEDLELGYKVWCDKEVGATSYIQSKTFNGLSSTVVWLPGRQDPTYFIAPNFFAWYPAHQVIETEGPYKGKKLSEVAPKDFTTLPEVTEKPMDVGPYMITEWKKGEYIKYAVNPYFYGPAPKTKNIVVLIVASENAEAQLLGGAIDLLDSSSVLGLTQILKDAADAGKIVVYLSPSPTWEHIDINLFLK
jgi:ABC-type transport system substrate-binding protein